MKTIAVLCAKDEDETVEYVVRETRKYVDEVIVVDDGSKNSINIIANDVTILRNKLNRGKGYSMRKGVSFKDADIYICADTDSQHSPKYIPDMLKLLKKNDFVKAYRCYDEMPWLKRAGNKGLSMIFNFLFSMYIFDSQCGFKAYNKKAIKTLLDCKEDRYEIEVEQLINFKKSGLKMAQYPIYVNYLTPETRPFDGIHIGWTLLKWKLKSIFK